MGLDPLSKLWDDDSGCEEYNGIGQGLEVRLGTWQTSVLFLTGLEMKTVLCSFQTAPVLSVLKCGKWFHLLSSVMRIVVNTAVPVPRQ